jgi:hypothetical protein
MSKSRLAARLLPALTVVAVLAASFLASPVKLPGSNLVASCGYSYGYGSGPTPVVDGVTPNFGGTGGGTNVTITGSGFCNNTTDVEFGTTAATSWVLDDDSHIRAVSPAHAAGTVDVTVTNGAGTSPTSVADHFTYKTDTPSVYTSQSPLRVLDTRSNGGRLGPGGTYVLTLGGISVPANATAVVINLTATNTTAPSFFTVYPTGQARPLASNLNWTAGQTVPNLAEVGLGTNGQISIFNSDGLADAIVDLEGYFAPPSSGTAGEFVPLNPARVTDTRTGSGQPNAGSHLSAGSTLNVQITGAGGVPLTGVDAVVLNATVTNTTAPSFLTVYPTGVSRPLASNLNWISGQTVPNRVIVKVGTGGKVSFFNAAGTTDLVVDVNGYITDATASGNANFSLSPSRILDTRNGTGGFGSPIGPNGTIAVTVAGQGGVPASGAVAVVINVTVTNTTAASVLTVYPNLTVRPNASDLNWVAGWTRANLVVVKLGTDGKIAIHNGSGNVNVIVDVVGWFG